VTLKKEIASANFLEDKPNYQIDSSLKTTYRTNVLTQFRWLLWRSGLAQMRNPLASYVAIIQTVVISIIFGLIYLRLKYDQAGIQNMNGVLFLMITNMSFSNLFAVINVTRHFSLDKLPLSLVVILCYQI
jgi:hypothetical protein